MPPAQEGELLEKVRDLMAGRAALPAHELINRLGNLHRLTDELIDWVGERFVVLAARERAADLEGTQALDVSGRIAIRVLPHNDAQLCALYTLTLRVLQARLWTLGYYDGAHFVATFWQHDFDTVNVISAGCPAELVARHGQVLDWMQRSTEAMLRVGLEIAQALLALGNWLLFAWRALRVVKQILREVSDPCLRELVAETAPI